MNSLPDPPFACTAEGCHLVTDDMGALDRFHVYCPHHCDGTIIHLRWRDPIQSGGYCPKCKRVFFVRHRDDELLTQMCKGGFDAFVPLRQVAELEALGYKAKVFDGR